jgi:hypothetical protein
MAGPQRSRAFGEWRNCQSVSLSHLPEATFEDVESLVHF